MPKHLFIALIVGSLLLSSAAFARTEKLRVDLSDRVLEGLIDAPKSTGPNPVVVIATGDDGEIGDRLYTKLAEGAVQAGFVSIRLEWTFKKAKGAPSPDLAREAEELGTLVNDMIASRMMKQYAVDATKVALIAKGFGAKVAMVPASGGTGEKVRATLLLNPACDAVANPFAKVYAPFLAGKTPRMIVASRGGPCPLSQIYSAGASFGEEVSVFTTAGDSTFSIEKNLINQDAAIAASLNWLKNREWVSAPATSKKKKTDAKKHSHDAHSAGTHP